MARRPHRPGVVSLSGQDPVPVQAHPRRVEANHVSQAGQVFADLLLVGATASRCPLALLTVVNGDVEHPVFWCRTEALEDPELFDIIAGRREPVEVTDPASNPALAHSRLARSTLGIRWLLGVPLLGPTGEVNAIFAVLDTEPRELSRRQRASMVATGGLISGALSAHRGGGPTRRASISLRAPQWFQADCRWPLSVAQPRSGRAVRRDRADRDQLGRFRQAGVPAYGRRSPAFPQRGRYVPARGQLPQAPH